MNIPDANRLITGYNHFHRQIKEAGLVKIKERFPTSTFHRYLFLEEMYIEKDKLVAIFNFSDDAPYSGAEEVEFTNAELEAL